MQNSIQQLRTFVLITACAIILAYRSSTGLAQTEARKHLFPNDAMQQWDKYRDFSYQLQGIITTSSEAILSDGKQVSSKFVTEFKQNNNCSLLLSRYFDERPVAEVVIVNNPQYSFQIIKRSQNKHDWLLANLQMSGDGSSFRGRSIRESASAWACLPFCIYERPLSSIVCDRNFKIIKQVELSHRGLPTVRIDFQYPHPLQEKDFYPIQSGTLYFDPNRYWCLVEAELNGKWTNGTGVVHERYEFKDGPNGFPIITSVTHTLKSDSRKSSVNAVIKTDFTVHPNVPTREFTLSAFGLPEPNGVVWERGPRYYLWFGIAAIACLGLMILCRRLARRKMAEKAQ